jgi:hypothetical protein
MINLDVARKIKKYLNEYYNSNIIIYNEDHFCIFLQEEDDGLIQFI